MDDPPNTPKQTLVVDSAVSWNRHRLVTMAPSFRAGVNPAAFASFACLAGTSIAWIRLSGDRKSERLKRSVSRLPAGRQAEHGTPAACDAQLVCIVTAWPQRRHWIPPGDSPSSAGHPRTPHTAGPAIRTVGNSCGVHVIRASAPLWLAILLRSRRDTTTRRGLSLSPPSGSGEGRRPRVGRPSHGLLRKSLNGDWKSERLKCSASRRARHASGVRSRRRACRQPPWARIAA